MKDKLLKNLNTLIIISIVILLIVLVRLVKLLDICCILLEIVFPIFFGFVIAWILHPLYKRLSKKVNNKVSFFLLIALLFLIYGLIILLVAPVLINETKNLVEVLKSYLPKIENNPYISDLFKNLKVAPDVLLASCGSIFSIVVNFGLAHLFGFYILYNYDTIKTLIKGNLPERYKSTTLKFTKKLSINMRLYLKGALIDMVFLFILSALLFSLFKFKYALLLALFCAITNIIPFIGPYIGGVPAVLVGLSQSFNYGIIALVIVVVSQNIESNIINPLIMSKCVKINPLFIVIAITIMGKFFGIIGMIFAVPLLIFLKIAYEFYSKYRQTRK